MAHHFEYVGKFKNKLSGNGFDFNERKDRALVLEIAIKCADVSNPAKPHKMCTRWSELIMEEFFKQGDEELARGMSVSMFMNRHDTNVPKCQVGFIDFIVGPLFEAWGSYLHGHRDKSVMCSHIDSNRSYWQGILDEADGRTSVATRSTSKGSDELAKSNSRIDAASGSQHMGSRG
eukprot:Opistho-2@67314